MSKTLRVLGMDLPIIADLPDGYHLVAHKNGPAIANPHLLSALDPPLTLPPTDVFDEPDQDDQDIPPRVYVAAIRRYVDWSWPLVREREKLT